MFITIRLFFLTAFFLYCTKLAICDELMSPLEMAQKTIILERMNASSASGRYACSHPGNFACVGFSKSELGLAIIMANKNMGAAKVLVDLLALALDAGMAEDYDCALVKNKSNVFKALKGASAQRLRDSCVMEFHALQRRMNGLYDDVSDDSVCRSLGDIKLRISHSVSLMKVADTCDW